MPERSANNPARQFVVELMKCLDDRGGTEVRLQVHSPPVLIMGDTVQNLSSTPMDAAQLFEIAAAILPKGQEQSWAALDQCEFDMYPHATRPLLNPSFRVTLTRSSVDKATSIAIHRIRTLP